MILLERSDAEELLLVAGELPVCLEFVCVED